MAVMGSTITTYLILLEVLVRQVLSTCPCAQLLPSPCNCQAGFMPFCTCIRPIIQYSCPCALPPSCHAACQRTCTSMCSQSGFGPSCSSSCGLSCLQSCMHQQAVPIQIVMNRMVALSGQCIPFCRKNCEKSCTPMVSTATCVPLCKQPCEQKCSQFTPTAVVVCSPMCRPSCSPQCIAGQQMLLQKLGQPIYGLIAPLALLTQPKSLLSIPQGEPNDSSTSASSLATSSSQSTPLGPTLIPSSAFETTSQPQTAEEGEYVNIPVEDYDSILPTEPMAFSEKLQGSDSTTPESEVPQLQRAVRTRSSSTPDPSTLFTFTTLSHAPFTRFTFAPFTRFTFTPKPGTDEETTPLPEEKISEVPASQILEENSPEQKRLSQVPHFDFSNFDFTSFQQCVAACMPECDPKCIEEQEKLLQKEANATTVPESIGRQMDYEFEFQGNSSSDKEADVSRSIVTSANSTSVEAQ